MQTLSLVICIFMAVRSETKDGFRWSYNLMKNLKCLQDDKALITSKGRDFNLADKARQYEEIIKMHAETLWINTFSGPFFDKPSKNAPDFGIKTLDKKLFQNWHRNRD